MFERILAPMKIVQSFWSKKFYDFKTRDAYNNCPTEEHEIYSRVLSCLLLSKLYDRVELVTDSKGKELLIDTLGLPYSSVTLELDKLDKYSTELFVLDEIYSMGIQKEPFIYIDENIFMWAALPSELNGHDVFTLRQKKYDYSDKAKLFDVTSQFETLNSYLYRSMVLGTFLQPQSGMIGFMGGNSSSFFQDYSLETFTFVDQYMPFMNELKYIVELNYVLTSEFFYNCCRKNKVIPVSYLPKYDDPEKISPILFNRNERFQHYSYNKNPYQINELESFLRYKFPEYYYRIQNMLVEKSF